MLEKLDLNRKMAKNVYKTAKEKLALRLSLAQRKLLELKIPVIILFEGWEASGKGTIINALIQPLDPRGFNVHSTFAPNEDERLRPFLWRFWTETPAQGRIAILDRSWYRSVLNERIEKKTDSHDLAGVFSDIASFERQLVDAGCVIVKFFLHISKAEQKKRFNKLRQHHSTAWRVTSEDLEQNRLYRKYIVAIEDMLAITDVECARWTVVEAHNHKYAVIKVLDAVAQAFEHAAASSQTPKVSEQQALKPTNIKRAKTDRFNISILDRTNPSLTLAQDEYKLKLKKKQNIIRQLEHELYLKRIPVVIVYEGWDAAGKGGSIRRLTNELDPRGYEVIPIGAPNDTEKAHHYFWRFWNHFPKAGHIAIFDRSWYGRVLVERVEGFCTPAEWNRAYREINEMEEHMANFGAVIIKFWLHIDAEEQLRRFNTRQATPYKRWKITEEDWRNRAKRNQYKTAVDEMLYRTSTIYAPWIVIESNCKRYARVKVLDQAIKAIASRIK